MKTQNSNLNSTNVALVAGSHHEWKATNPQSAVFSNRWIVRALLLMLFAALAMRASAQNIYVSNSTGSWGNPPSQAYVGAYHPDGTAINTSLLKISNSEIWALGLTGNTLVVPHWDLNGLNGGGVNEYDATTGLQSSFSVGSVSAPHGVVVGGSHMFVLYGAGMGAIAEYPIAGGAALNSDVSQGSLIFGQEMAGWTDASGNVTLYVTNADSGTGLPNTGFIEKVTVSSSGALAHSTLVSALNFPQGIAVSADGQSIFVVTGGVVGNVSKYSNTGAWQWTSPTISGTPWSVAASGGALYVTLNTANAVGEYSASSGAPINASLITGLVNPLGIVVGPPSCVRPPANMVVWYPFDQTGNSQEDLANENTATAYNTVSIAGEVANGLQFNGSNAYVEAPSQASNNLGTGNFSIDAWVKIANSNDDSGVVVLLDKRDANFGYHLYLYNRTPGLQLDDSAGYTNYGTTIAIPADNQWHLLAVTVTRNSHTGGLWYLDGASIGTFDPTAHPGSLNSTNPLDIGVRTTVQGGGGNFKGGIDELEIFTRALSSAEVFSLVQAGPAGKCKCVAPPSNMVAWYAFDQTGSSQSDLAKGNTATAYGTTTITGEVANALQFNGASAYLQAPNQSWLNMGTGDFSIDAWVKIASSTDDPGVVSIVDKRDAYPNEGFQFFLYNHALGLQLADSLGYSNYISTTTVPTDNQWHLVAVTVSRNSATGGIWYLDGQPVGAAFNPTGHPNSINSSIALSIGESFSGEYFKGGLDELEIFNRALSRYEVLSLMQAGPAGKCKN